MAAGTGRKRTNARWQSACAGVQMRRLVEGEGTALVLYRIAAGCKFRAHTHRFPEYGTVIAGRGLFHLPEGKRPLREGDSYYIPSDIPHGFEVPPGYGTTVILHVAVGLAAQVRVPMFRHLVRQARAMSQAVAEPLADAPRVEITAG